MEKLVHSLRNLDLAVPNGEQIVALIDADPRAEKQLAQQLAVPVRIELSEEDAGSAVMDAALMSGATEAMLENYNTTLKKETDMLVREVENLEKPIKLKRIPLKALLAAQDATIRRREVERAAGTSENGRVYIPRQIMDTEHTYCSERPLSELSRIDWDDLCAPKRFEHKYLLVQVASRLALYASCSFVGVTPNGGALPVSIAHFTPNLHLHGPELDALLPVGTKLLIREPYLSQHYLGVGGPITGDKGVVGVRVDTPSDVHVLDDDAPVLRGVTWTHDLDAPMPSDVLWRQEGPVSRAPSHAAPFISRERVQSAVRALLDQERPGAAWREVRAAERYGIWGASLEDTLLQVDVLLALGQYDQALERLQHAPDLEESVLQRRQAAEVALRLGRGGPSDTDLHEMFLCTLHDPTPRFAYAEYVGPVNVQDIPGAGRGLVLTRDVEEGELLLFCRAIGSAYAKDPACDGLPLLRCNPDVGVTSTTTQVLAATRCIHAILDRPELARIFLGLTAGPQTPCSRYVYEPYPLHKPAASDVLEPVYVSAHYVNNVLRFNAFGPAAVPAAEAGNDPMSRSTMPHPLPAILNHACLPNVSSVFFGDFVTTRALHPLPKGTQIMHQYVQGELPYDARQAQLSKHGFICTCRLCALDVADGVEQRKRREEVFARDWPPLLERSRALFKGRADSEAHKDMAEALLAAASTLESTYAPTRGALRPDMVDVWYRVAMHVRQYDVPQAVRLARQSLEATGAVIEPFQPGKRHVSHLPDLHFDGAIRSMLMLFDTHWQRHEADEALAWIDAALQTHMCMIGGGRALFVQRWAHGDYPLDAWLATC